MDTGIKEQQSIWHSVRELLVSKAIDFEMFNKVKACQVRVITVHDPPPLLICNDTYFHCMLIHTVQIKLSYSISFISLRYSFKSQESWLVFFPPNLARLDYEDTGNLCKI